jgi:protein-tyrosine phosphatase
MHALDLHDGEQLVLLRHRGHLRRSRADYGSSPVIDLHSHILPGLDDGVESLPAAVELARAAVADGVHVIAATPHVRDDYPTSADDMQRALESTRAALAAENVPLELRPGGEIALDRLPQLEEDELQRFALGGSARTLMLEFPYYGWPLSLEDALFELRVRGFRIVLAHPERNDEVQSRPERLARLVETGTLIQLTAASLDGRLGIRTRTTAVRLLELGHAHLIASDAHAPSVRHVGISTAAAAVGDPALARWLTIDVPQAILDDAPLNVRPATRARRRLWRRN